MFLFRERFVELILALLLDVYSVFQRFLYIGYESKCRTNNTAQMSGIVAILGLVSLWVTPLLGFPN